MSFLQELRSRNDFLVILMAAIEGPVRAGKGLIRKRGNLADASDGRPLLVRPIRSEDEERQQALLARTTPEDIRFRRFRSVERLPHLEMARLTQIDYNREMAFISVATKPDGSRESLGVVRTRD